MKQILLVLCGIPSSGKSTFAKSIKTMIPAYDFEIINTDTWRDEEYYSEFKPEKENEVRASALDKTDEMLSQGKSIIHDDTNYYTSMRHELLKLAEKYKCDFGVIHITTPRDIALKWNEGRKRVIPPYVIERIASRLDTPGKKYAWDEPLFQYDPNNDSIEVAIGHLKKILSSIPRQEKSDNKEGISDQDQRDRVTRRILAGFFTKHKEYRGSQDILKVRKEVLNKANSENLSLDETTKILRDRLEEELAAS
ncbi:MAG: AAA family ATPase [Candidatus Lokiarchaeota archaeon]|nr:AAA family ATPase [Candidatus Lokiarchaeota archaeon]